MATREPDRPLQRWVIARGRSASLPLSYTTTRDTTCESHPVLPATFLSAATLCRWAECHHRHFLASYLEALTHPTGFLAISPDPRSGCSDWLAVPLPDLPVTTANKRPRATAPSDNIAHQWVSEPGNGPRSFLFRLPRQVISHAVARSRT